MFAAVLGLSVDGSSIEIAMSDNSPVKIGSNLTIYCVAVNSSNTMQWYKRAGNDGSRIAISNTNGTQVRNKQFSFPEYFPRLYSAHS